MIAVHWAVVVTRGLAAVTTAEQTTITIVPAVALVRTANLLTALVLLTTSAALEPPLSCKRQE